VRAAGRVSPLPSVAECTRQQQRRPLQLLSRRFFRGRVFYHRGALWAVGRSTSFLVAFGCLLIRWSCRAVTQEAASLCPVPSLTAGFFIRFHDMGQYDWVNRRLHIAFCLSRNEREKKDETSPVDRQAAFATTAAGASSQGFGFQATKASLAQQRCGKRTAFRVAPHRTPSDSSGCCIGQRYGHGNCCPDACLVAAEVCLRK